ncbi:hypothetical protein WY02_26800 [Pseudonocardia sp. AL041005-10]|nr:hypothetical protein [Pseudonocardia sp. AL041005-10]ALE81377.1 hypothetical protein WY02_26800 [Pseudonocardia sp. AL041005-10]
MEQGQQLLHEHPVGAGATIPPARRPSSNRAASRVRHRTVASARTAAGPGPDAATRANGVPVCAMTSSQNTCSAAVPDSPAARRATRASRSSRARRNAHSTIAARPAK